MDKPSLILLPGLLNDARLWAAQTSALSGDAAVSAGDLAVADTISGLAASVLSRAPTERFALAGLSMGGYVALEIMRQAPERVTALALLDTSARADTPASTEGRRALMRLAETDFPAVIDALFPKLVLPAHARDEALRRVFTNMALAAGKEAFLRQQAAIMGRIDSRPFLRHVACPTLVLCGRDDAVTPVEVHEEIAAAVPGARLEVVDECGHLSALEKPEAVTQALKEWLARAKA